MNMSCFVHRYCSLISKCGRGRSRDGSGYNKACQELGSTPNNWSQACREVSLPADTFGAERLCDNECEGCEKTPGCILLELNESREEKVKDNLGESSGLLSNDESGKAAWEEANCVLHCWVPCGPGCQASFGVGWKEGLAVKSGC
jgi:hypothetical protein